jgi:hypothetical protein
MPVSRKANNSISLNAAQSNFQFSILNFQFSHGRAKKRTKILMPCNALFMGFPEINFPNLSFSCQILPNLAKRF